MRKKTYIGIDMGGTTIEGGLVSSHGRIIRRATSFVPSHRKKRTIIRKVRGVIEKLLNSNTRCVGIGLGWPAAVNIPIRGTTIRWILEKQFKLPVYLDNDANCFALAEALIGSGKKYSIVVGITLGTGVGCGIVIDKKLYHGKGEASEFGHTSLNYRGHRCACGNYGCLEEYVGKRGVARLAKKYGNAKIEGYDLYQLAQERNKEALLVWKEMGKLLGIGIVNAINAYDPEVIILGGKISRAWKYFSKEMKREIKRRSFIKPCPIKVSTLKNSAITGAALLAKQNL